MFSSHEPGSFRAEMQSRANVPSHQTQAGPMMSDHRVDLIYIDPPFNSNRNYEVFWGETKEKRSFEDRHASTQAFIEYMRPRCVQLARVLKKTGSFDYHCDWHGSYYVKVHENEGGRPPFSLSGLFCSRYVGLARSFFAVVFPIVKSASYILPPPHR
jgi:hypothetical protein